MSYQWTPDRVERLKALWAEGCTPKDIHAQMDGPSVKSIQGKAASLGLKRVNASAAPEGYWTDERVETAKRMRADGYSASQIARALGGGVTRNATLGKLYRLGVLTIAKPSAPGARPTVPRGGDLANLANGWPADRTARLKQLWADGLPPAEIARTLGDVTYSAVVRKARRLGLSFKPVEPAERPPREPTLTPRTLRMTGKGVMIVEPQEQHEPRAGIRADAWMPLEGREPKPLGGPGCKWPIDGFEDPMCCGAPKPDGQPYCPVHAARAQAPARDGKPRSHKDLERKLRRVAYA